MFNNKIFVIGLVSDGCMVGKTNFSRNIDVRANYQQNVKKSDYVKEANKILNYSTVVMKLELN